MHSTKKIRPKRKRPTSLELALVEIAQGQYRIGLMGHASYRVVLERHPEAAAVLAKLSS